MLTNAPKSLSLSSDEINSKTKLIKDESGVDALFEDGHRQTLVYGDGLAAPFQLPNGQIVIGTGKDIIIFSPDGNSLKIHMDRDPG